MIAALIIASAIIIAGIALYIHHRLTGGDRPALPDTAAQAQAEEECCGRHAVCERDSLLAAVSQKIEYYDDEELDAFAGRDPESYSPSESEHSKVVSWLLRQYNLSKAVQLLTSKVVSWLL